MLSSCRGIDIEGGDGGGGPAGGIVPDNTGRRDSMPSLVGYNKSMAGSSGGVLLGGGGGPGGGASSSPAGM